MLHSCVSYQIPDKDLEKRRCEQRVDPLTDILYTKNQYAPNVPVKSEKDRDEDEEEDEEEEELEEESIEEAEEVGLLMTTILTLMMALTMMMR